MSYDEMNEKDAELAARKLKEEHGVGGVYGAKMVLHGLITLTAYGKNFILDAASKAAIWTWLDFLKENDDA